MEQAKLAISRYMYRILQKSINFIYRLQSNSLYVSKDVEFQKNL